MCLVQMAKAQSKKNIKYAQAKPDLQRLPLMRKINGFGGDCDDDRRRRACVYTYVCECRVRSGDKESCRPTVNLIAVVFFCWWLVVGICSIPFSNTVRSARPISLYNLNLVIESVCIQMKTLFCVEIRVLLTRFALTQEIASGIGVSVSARCARVIVWIAYGNCCAVLWREYLRLCGGSITHAPWAWSARSCK